MRIAFDFDETIIDYIDDFKKWSVSPQALKLMLKLLEGKHQVFIVTARCPALSRKNIHSRSYICPTRHRALTRAFNGIVRYLDLPTVEGFVKEYLPKELAGAVTIIYTDGALKGSFLADEGIELLIDDSEEQRADALKHHISAVHPADIEPLIRQLKEIGVF